MSASCGDLEQVLMDGSPGPMAALEAHARGCPGCARELREWRQLSEVAGRLRKSWDSPDLQARIQRALVAERPRPALIGGLGSWLSGLASPRGVIPAAALGLAVVAAGAWLIRGRATSEPAGTLAALEATSDPLLTDQAVDQVEAAERHYVAAIERLSKLVGSTTPAGRSPLARSYREKLALVDAAIAELQAGIHDNRLNSHLRRELLALYQEKQQTLRDLMQLSAPADRKAENP